jgi:hypothetical protein
MQYANAQAPTSNVSEPCSISGHMAFMGVFLQVSLEQDSVERLSYAVARCGTDTLC